MPPKPTKTDWDTSYCPLCRTGQHEPAVPGLCCTGLGCNSYLVVIVGGKRDGQLMWHHIQECEEYPDEVCPHCEVWVDED